MMKYFIRTATAADIVNMATLAVYMEYKSSKPEQAHAWIQSILESTSDQIWLCCDQQNVFGWVHAFIARRMASPPFVEIGGLVVDPEFRCSGIGKKLVQEAQCWAQSLKMPMRVRCNQTRQETHAFYEKIGLSPIKHQIVFSCE